GRVVPAALGIAGTGDVARGENRMVVAAHEIVVEIGTMPILVRTESAEFAEIVQNRYTGYVNPRAKPVFEFDVEIVPPQLASDEDEDVSGRREAGRWMMQREDFKA